MKMILKMPKKLTKKEFIEKSIVIHGIKYDYRLVDYKNSHTKVIILFNNIEYKQTPHDHLAGKCPDRRDYKKSLDIFIEESREVHGDKYDYSLVKYNGGKKKVKIIFETL